MPSEKVNRIAWPVRTGFVFTNREDVLYCKAEGSYTHVHLIDGANLLISYKLKAVENILNTLPFFRTHESWLANLEYATGLHRQDGALILYIKDTPIIVAKARKRLLIDTFYLLHEMK